MEKETKKTKKTKKEETGKSQNVHIRIEMKETDKDHVSYTHDIAGKKGNIMQALIRSMKEDEDFRDIVKGACLYVVCDGNPVKAAILAGLMEKL